MLLGPDGPRVVDFGIARLTDASTITSGLIGSPCFIAPEQIAGARPTSAVDVFAWAVTMIFAATGRSAFGNDTVPAVMQRILYQEPDVSGVPPSLLPVIEQCLDKDPNRRPSARDVLLRLVDPAASRPLETRIGAEPAAAGFAVGPARTGPARTGPYPPSGPSAPFQPGTTPAPSRRGPILAVCGAIVAGALIVGGVLLLTRGSPGHPGTAAGSTSAAAHTSSQVSASASTTAPATGVSIPAAFAGTWSGTATMAALGAPGIGLKNSISFTFAPGAKTAHENNQSCVNTLTLTTATATVLTFSEPQTAACVAGTVTFTRHAANLDYRWTDNLEQNTATLHKAGPQA